MSMYPDEQTVVIYGEEVSYPGLKNGKFTSGNPADPADKPSFIPAETINLLIDNIAAFITLLGGVPDNANVNQIASVFFNTVASKIEIVAEAALARNAANLLSGLIPLDRYLNSNVLTKLKEVDGPGSGLDAEFMSGLGIGINGEAGLAVNTSPVYNQIKIGSVKAYGPTAAGIPPLSGYYCVTVIGGGDAVNQTTYLAQGLGATGTRTYLGYKTGSEAITWIVLWNEGNDGPGSGLNADFLSGAGLGTFAAASAADCNNNTKNGLYYCDASRVNDPYPSSQYSIMLVLAQGASSVLQYAFALSTPGLIRYRYFNGSSWTVWSGQVWTSAVDGAGSGMDTDLVRGREPYSFGLAYPTFTEGNKVWRRLDVMASALTTSWVKKSATYTCEKSGTLRVQWYMWRETSGGAAGVVRKNGVQVASEQSVSSASPSPITQDVPVAAGDTIEVWGYKTSSSEPAYLTGVSILTSEDGPAKNAVPHWDRAESVAFALEVGQMASGAVDGAAASTYLIVKTQAGNTKIVTAAGGHI